ncbi:NADPH-dependent FMN reductase [Olleya aquimaris]|uniref:NAD(P)H-dependent FMN reductase n=1 Tax=Olleya aquimaris TaxID=639310 RepID=A0A327RGX4_9FLAO|nr:NAD(P)H-dependent oxidoreductase [Olleya aquimaris]RAJ16280.1 NAD(P)H-dependent FMN reductase [Olleya aquimaris]
MKKIIAFGASNSSSSINKQLATYASTLVENVETEVLDLNNFDVPTYSIDIEKQSGIPDNAQHFFDKIGASDGVIISLAEHNGAYTAAFKSLFDWMSRIDVKLFQEKPMLLMSTAPGPRGGLSVFEMAEGRFHRHDATIVAKFRLPSFNDNFKDGKISNPELNDLLLEAVTIFNDSI